MLRFTQGHDAYVSGLHPWIYEGMVSRSHTPICAAAAATVVAAVYCLCLRASSSSRRYFDCATNVSVNYYHAANNIACTRSQTCPVCAYVWKKNVSPRWFHQKWGPNGIVFTSSTRSMFVLLSPRYIDPFAVSNVSIWIEIAADVRINLCLSAIQPLYIDFPIFSLDTPYKRLTTTFLFRMITDLYPSRSIIHTTRE